MKNLIVKIILIGIVCGLVMTGLVMLLGCVAFYIARLAQISLSVYFMEIAAFIALSTGILTAVSWYSYLFIIVKRYFFKITLKENKK